MENQLLPEGFKDSLPETAYKEFKISTEFIKIMKKKNYMLVRPTLLEFEKSMFFLTKGSMEKNSFRVLDPLSQKLMAIRSDITTQIARISCGALKFQARPLRVMYFGDILRVNNSQLNTARHSTQLGGEIIGVKNEENEIEIIKIISEILKKFKINNYKISLSMPTILKSVSLDFNLNKEQELYLKNCYDNKNLMDLKNISTEIHDISSKLLNRIGPLDKIYQFLISENFPSKTQCEINKFLTSLQNFKKKLTNENFIVDTVEIDKSGYHNGLMFKFYSDKLTELFSGGSYEVNKENCIGFSALVENLINN